MNLVMERAKTSWLLAFGDVITLLLTFFIVVVVMNNSQITAMESWVEDRLNESYKKLDQQIQLNQLSLLSVAREPRGLRINIESDKAFDVGSYAPSEELRKQLSVLSPLLNEMVILNISQNPEGESMLSRADKEGMKWFAEIAIQGHTDHSWVNPESRLRNNTFLSTLRAEAVMTNLQDLAEIDSELFSISGYGEWQPIADNSTEEGRQKNRRVEILITASFISI